MIYENVFSFSRSMLSNFFADNTITYITKTKKKHNCNTTEKNISFTKAKMQFYHLMTLSKNVGLFLREKFFEMIKNVVFDFSKKLVYIFCNTFQWRDLLKKKLSLFFGLLNECQTFHQKFLLRIFDCRKVRKSELLFHTQYAQCLHSNWKRPNSKKVTTNFLCSHGKKISLKKSVAD